MHDYLFSAEAVRFAFVAGVVVSMLLYERYHLTTGSIVVPGYLALFLPAPSVLLATIANVSSTYFLTNRLLPRWVLLYGRTKFTVQVLVAIAIQSVMLKTTPSGPWLWEADFPLLVGVGYVVPALIAHDMARQGIRKTAMSVSLAAVLVAIPMALLLLLGLEDVPSGIAGSALVAPRLDVTWTPIAIMLSAAAAWGVLVNHGLRAGGFVGAALMATFAVNVWQILLLVGVALLTHLVVSRVMMRRMILFGRRKFASMLLLSSIVVWALVWAAEQLLPLSVQHEFGILSLALTPLFLPGLMANDMERTSRLRLLLGMSLSSIFVFAATQTVQTLSQGHRPTLASAAVAAASTGVIFRPQLRVAGVLVVSAAARRLTSVWGVGCRVATASVTGAVQLLEQLYEFLLPMPSRPPLFMVEAGSEEGPAQSHTLADRVRTRESAARRPQHHHRPQHHYRPRHLLRDTVTTGVPRTSHPASH